MIHKNSDGATKNNTALTWDVNILNITNAEVFSVNTLLASGCGAWLAYTAHDFFNGMALARTPFTTKSVHSLSMIGIISLISAVGVPIVMGIVEAATKTTQLFSNAWYGTSIFFALFIFFLSLIFKYGVILQKEADTTL
jgi:hypothetical protein